MRPLPILALLLFTACTDGQDDPADTGETDTAETGDTGEADPGPTEPSTLAATGERACALAPDALRCWGGGEAVAIVPDVHDDAVQAALSGEARCWVVEAGQVYCTPLEGESAPGLRIDAVALDLTGGPDGFCAVNGDRSVSCWPADGDTPASVTDALGAVRTYTRAGTGNWALVQANGVLQEWAWGEAASTNTVVRGAEQVAAGVAHTCIRTTATEAQCWGSDALGQTGVDGSGTVSDADRVVAIASGVDKLVGGANHLCALLDDGTVTCWGDNSLGQLGRGTAGDPSHATTPGAVPGLAGVLDLAAGDDFTCAALDDASVRCWGAGTAGQLGAEADSASPVTVIAPAG